MCRSCVKAAQSPNAPAAGDVDQPQPQCLRARYHIRFRSERLQSAAILVLRRRIPAFSTFP